MKKLKRLNRLYFNDKTRKWELINYANNQQKTKGSIYWLNEETPKLIEWILDVNRKIRIHNDR